MWRNLQTGDDDAIIAMCSAFYQEDPGPRPVPVEHTRQTLMKFRQDPGRGIIAVLETGGEICGYAILVFFWSNELGGEICNLDEFYVKSAERGKGQGRKFLEALAARDSSFSVGHKAIDLEVTPKNQRAGEFYASLGFKPARNAHLRLRF